MGRKNGNGNRNSHTNDNNGKENGNSKELVATKPSNSKKVIKISPKNPRQTEALRKIKANEIIFLLGPAGSGKTYLAIIQALQLFLKHDYKRLILTRPVVEAGENLGFLPGSLEEKTRPYMAPIFDHLRGYYKKEELDSQMEEKKIEVIPLAYTRGRTYNNSLIIADEVQNATDNQLKMLLTRIGENSKMILTADPEQTDLRKSNSIVEISRRLSEHEGIDQCVFELEDIVRNPVIEKILHVFKEIKYEQELVQNCV